MTLGSRTRRAWPGLAALTMIVALAGCHAMPVASLPAKPNRPQSMLASALTSATVAMDPPSEMSSIEPVTIPLSKLTLAESPPETPPTPLLDAALEKAKGLDEIILGEMSKPQTSPNSNPSPPPVQAQPVTEPIALAASPPLSTPAPVPSPTPPNADPKPKEAEAPRPEELWRDGVRRLGSLARAKLEQSSGSASPWGLRTRVLAWLAEPDIDPDLVQHEADSVRAVLRALDDSQTEKPRRGAEVRSAVTILEDKAPLEIVDLRICSKVEGFGDFEPIEPPVRKAGQQIILYCEIDGIRAEPTSAGFRTRTSALMEILPDRSGEPILTRPLGGPGATEETCRRHRRDYFIPYLFVLPRTLAPGDYQIRLTIKDLTADRLTTREVAFTIAKD